MAADLLLPGRPLAYVSFWHDSDLRRCPHSGRYQGESGPDADIVESKKLTRTELVGSAREGSDFDLFRYGKSIINLDAKVAHRTLDLCVAKQELNGSQIARAPID
jgi:hypothetical protein